MDIVNKLLEKLKKDTRVQSLCETLNTENKLPEETQNQIQQDPEEAPKFEPYKKLKQRFVSMGVRG